MKFFGDNIANKLKSRTIDALASLDPLESLDLLKSLKCMTYWLAERVNFCWSCHIVDPGNASASKKDAYLG